VCRLNRSISSSVSIGPYVDKSVLCGGMAADCRAVDVIRSIGLVKMQWITLGASLPVFQSSAKIGDPGDRAVIHRIDNVHRPPGSSHTTAKKDRSN